eukprot:1421615-Pleurochrysis_carterae.AAC.2
MDGKNASILGNGRFWPISIYSLEWSTILENGWFPTWGPTYTKQQKTTRVHGHRWRARGCQRSWWKSSAPWTIYIGPQTPAAA